MKHNHDLAHIRSCVVRGKKFKIIWRGHREYQGRCEAPNELNKTINICKTGSSLELLLLTVHETIHAAFYDLEEKAVEQYELDLHHLLTRMGITVSFTRHAKKQKVKKLT
jgi:hypothetical protein